jgi:hypothetical protein
MSERIIISHLIGGLGNQMFQYATGLSLAKMKNVSFKVDISDFDQYKLHNYCLDQWSISAKVANFSEIKSVKKKNIFLRSRVFEEKGFQYDEAIFKIEPPSYLKGYWQSEKYFIRIRDILLQEFKPKNDLSSYSIGIAGKINTSAVSVSLHVRRGDYLLDKNQKTHGVCTLDYYTKAIASFEYQYKDIVFFIFSDDIDWAKKYLKFKSERIWCDGNDASRNHEDIFLMSICQHNIIANSSFSWWGAWLNDNIEKVVIAPKAWFQTSKLDASDLYCNGWILI